MPPSLAPGWDDWTFWQTGVSRIPGVGRLDGNYFSGKKKDLDALKLRPFTIAGGAVASGGGRVELDLGGRDATHLRTSPDGEQCSEWDRIQGTPETSIPSEEGQHAVYAQFRNGPGPRSPVFSDSIFVDATPPEVSPPTVLLRAGPMVDADLRVPVSVTWEARDTNAGLSDASVAVSCGEDREIRTDAPGSGEPNLTTPWEAATALFLDATCEVTAIAQDGAGNRARATSGAISTTLVQLGQDETATATLSGIQFGIVARRGPDAGRASVSIDGQGVGLFDLYAPVVTGPEVVYVGQLDGTAQEIAVEPTDTADTASTGTSVVIDGFVSLGAAS
jgi:hypothetical protein